MIGTVLDQVQKLSGRGFLIAAFIPSCIFFTLVSYLWLDSEKLGKLLMQWTQKELKEASINLVLALIVTCLFAYVLYGIRTAVHQLYQGNWLVPFKWLAPIGLTLARRTISRRQAILVEKESLLDDAYWAKTNEFKEMYTTVRLKPLEAQLKLKQSRRVYQCIHKVLQDDQEWQERTYWNLLREVRLLQANTDKLSVENQQKEVANLVEDLKKDYKDEENRALRIAVENLETQAWREWEGAYSDLWDNFPEDERWLRPTRLGNLFGVLELHPLRRYGIDLSSMWPRLSHVISDDVRRRIEEANIYLDFTVIMSLLLFVFHYRTHSLTHFEIDI